MTTKAETTILNSGLFERMQDMNRSWVESLREIRQIESHFASRLLAARSESEATAVCKEWMAKRVETVASEQLAFTTAWLELICDVTKPTSVTSAKASEQHAQ